MVHLRERLAIFIREKRGTLPQREFARKIGVAQSTIMRIENLDQNVTINTLETLCRVFHADIGDLFPRLENPKTYPPIRSGLAAPSAHSTSVLHEKAPNSFPAKNSPKKGPAKQ